MTPQKLALNVHSSFTYKSQKVEITIIQMMDKQNVVHVPNGILFGHEKE